MAWVIITNIFAVRIVQTESAIKDPHWWYTCDFMHSKCQCICELLTCNRQKPKARLSVDSAMEQPTIANSTESDKLLSIKSLIAPMSQLHWAPWLLVVAGLTVVLSNVFNTWIICIAIYKGLLRRSSFDLLVINNSVQKGLLGYFTWAKCYLLDHGRASARR